MLQQPHTFKYILDGSEYVLVDQNDRTVSRMPEVAVAYSQDPEIGFVLHKHGHPDRISAWADKTLKQYSAMGFADMAAQLQVISGKFPLEDINLIISSPGSLGFVLKKLGLLNITQPHELRNPGDGKQTDDL